MKYLLILYLSLLNHTAYIQSSTVSDKSKFNAEQLSEDEKAVMAVVVKVFDEN